MNEQELIERCRNKDRLAQRELYETYSPKMMGVCMRYVKNREDAEDVLVEGFFKVFDNISKFKSMGSFEGWIRRIVVNQSLMFLRKRHNFNISIESSNIEPQQMAVAPESDVNGQDLLNLLQTLPTGYRTVFNLYVLEGFKHREIAEQLGISINTSKSQLLLAKKRLQTILQQNKYPGVG